ncbi:MAG: serine dehydratase beta chain [Faecalibacterium prausnitzii]
MRLFDVLGPVMIGPSSSHTAGCGPDRIYGPEAAGRRSRAEADIGLYGSFATTGRGHGTDRALVGGSAGPAARTTPACPTALRWPRRPA